MELRGGSKESRSYEFGVEDELMLTYALREFKTHMENLLKQTEKELIIHITVTPVKRAKLK
jgi:hypothetical protein